MQEQTVAVFQGHENGRSLAMGGSFFAEVESTCATVLIDTLVAALCGAWECHSQAG